MTVCQGIAFHTQHENVLILVSMAFSSVGRTKVASHLILLFVNIIVLALSARVNLFQGFFFHADLFPLALSIITFVIIVFLLALDFALNNSYTGRAQFEIGVFGVLSIFWLSFNAFSTSRWRQVPFHCNSIPSEPASPQIPRLDQLSNLYIPHFQPTGFLANPPLPPPL
ncbi:uncharacterized protein LACBIDRAFT_334678 [Laccaria bicolor S238N-H82]|uniref:Predicted protein n=1 Tax=Laccaria bicolor (strain S238N-H82 / ATCC MYA-4686) TaxID=486041 RepID=B0DZX7_LACBS|nr:uncharacterized protein LACBIDRAFT_334678 [Laccaria bicolor S238N-H82]EDQ99837.1 predicted protein [Laccaria bicolor S238N-H82]|eukprot:XP_001889529.1 predicted protein [Laccaria bicolor S238N-H82]